jgi:hypothetical protein
MATAGVIYVWVTGALDDRNLTIMIVVVGVATLFAVDVPYLIAHRKRK